MIIKNMALVIFFMLSSMSILSAQKIYKSHQAQFQTFKNENFIYQNRVYKYHELEEILRSNPGSSFYFGKAEKFRQQALIFTVGSATSFLAGLATEVFFTDLNECSTNDGLCFDWGQVAASFMIYLVTPALISVSLSQSILSSNNKRKAISVFNDSSIDIGVYENPRDWELRIASTQGGMGLVLNF